MILSGGLGNQMFEYSFARALSLELGSELYLDPTQLGAHTPKREYMLDIFPNIKNPILQDPGRIGYHSDIRSFFDPDYFNRLLQGIKSQSHNADTLALYGYYQCPSMFEKYEDQIRKDFELPYAKLDTEKTPIIIQVRRGDFVENSFHGICTVDYYNKAIQTMIDKISNECAFIVISEDVEWVMNNLNFQGKEVIANPLITDQKPERDDFRIMISCKHHIISNSSYGWWPAWLSNPEVVICPNRWYANNMDHHMILPNWTTIET